jgi:hypothetical protein
MDVIQEAGWQFEFEIRESALIKLQQQLQEDVPAPPVGPEVRASGLSFLRQFCLQIRHNLLLSDETWVVCQHRLGSNKIPKTID